MHVHQRILMHVLQMYFPLCLAIPGSKHAELTVRVGLAFLQECLQLIIKPM